MNQDIIKRICTFRDERNWAQFHNPKDLAISVSLEASELLELFQWMTPEEAVKAKLPELKDELADVLIYCVLMADRLQLDLDEIIKHKLEKNGDKYPVDKAYNRSDKYDKL